MNNAQVLYVEDELSLGKITGDMLAKSGFAVQWAQDGLKGLELFVPGQFDICIIDIMLPGMDGYTLVKEIRQKDADIPIIFLTARSLTEDVVKGFDVGGNDYLKKPFSIEELVVRMNALLKRASKTATQTTDATIYTIGQYSFDRAAMELSYSDKKIVLTHLENELLYRLITHKNEILPRQKVLLELWKDDSFFNARSMDVFITKLRKHFANDPAISIVNIRGIGYKMIVRE
ncbi:response regulator transcription factor [Flavobacterium subsaxonicum]|uniref:Transcriptional regulator n=1 Tax=Flavobacterium subsaxonicum WB 4.1-42 = DSM 21790 TaxID=1121898 RepID=A0A0A2MMY8_9FLAO|nr:response regulator transcription factor [Flavobacterium subsaxonicum]KGO92838.1 transcriptional regulator [Flavobacterium subsaxonicum WB 4.1-42 = DSM 21790]